jgi:hypothetical protein
MVDKIPATLEEDGGELLEKPDLSAAEIEVRLAIADYVIRRVGGTPRGQEIFDALISRFENRYPHHKLLANCLTSPGHIDHEYLV